MRGRWLIAALAALGAGGTAHAQDAQSDPFESFNRAMFSFNARVDQYALEPVAKGYRAITPTFVRTGVSNALSNLAAPVTFANDVLQAEPTRAGTTLARFGINTTVGVVGLFDVARGVGLEKHTEDFGQTLGVWGVKTGPYLVLPLLGPSTVRDGTGRIVDAAFDPLNYAQFDGDDAVRIGRGVLTVVSAREGAIEAIDSLQATSIDPYVSIRTTYLLLRESAVQNGQTNVQDLPDFEEIPSASEPPPEPAPAETPSQGN
jgi:phospholipid-binding lipoprotein MlaA